MRAKGFWKYRVGRQLVGDRSSALGVYVEKMRFRHHINGGEERGFNTVLVGERRRVSTLQKWEGLKGFRHHSSVEGREVSTPPKVG